MQLDYIREFIVLTQYMNYTKAALALNMTQPCLSKHMRQLENDIHATLFTKNSLRPSLTPAGKHLLKTAQTHIDAFDLLMEECRMIDQSCEDNISVREPTFLDRAAQQLFSAVAIFQNRYDIPVNFVQTSYESPVEQIRFHGVDAHIVYHFRAFEDVIAISKELGVSAVPLTSEPIVVRLPKDHRLAGRERIAICDLKGENLLSNSQVYDPLRLATDEMCSSRGFQPHYEIALAESISNYCAASSINKSLQLLPESSKNDPRFLADTTYIFLPMEEDAVLNSLLLVSDSEDGPRSTFREFLQREMPR